MKSYAFYYLYLNQNLKSETIGRIAIYAPIMTTTTSVLDGVPLEHGLAVIARQQTAGKGRSNNQVYLIILTHLC